jgi:hypothetical protein
VIPTKPGCEKKRVEGERKKREKAKNEKERIGSGFSNG